MGLPCATHLANLACYTVEAEFSQKCELEDMEMNFGFIDDILTLTRIIPTEKEYGMKYKTTWPTIGKEGDTGQRGRTLGFLRGCISVTCTTLCVSSVTPTRTTWSRMVNGWECSQGNSS